MGKELHSCPRRDCPHSPNSAKEPTASCKSSSGKHLQIPSQCKHSPLRVALQLICSPRSDQVEVAANRCMWIMSQNLHTNTWENLLLRWTLPCPRALYLLLEWGCVQERGPFSRCISCPTSERLEQMVMCSASSLRTKTFLLWSTECLEDQYLLLFPRGCWQRHHWRAVIYHLNIYLHLCLKKSGNLPDLEVLNQIWWAD